MHPILFEIGSLKIHSFGVMMVLAFFTGLYLSRLRAPKFAVDPTKLSDAAIWVLVWGVLGARLFYLLQNIGHFREHPDELMTLQFQGLTSFGGVLFGAAYLIYWAKRCGYAVRAVLDTVAPAMLVGHAVGRVGCYLNGCCYGGQCPPDMPLALHVHGLSYTVHPAQLYDALMNLAAYAFLVWREKRGLALGQASGLFLMLHGLARFIYEYWRVGETAERLWNLPITEAQAVAGFMCLLGVWLYVKSARDFAGSPQEVGLA